MINWNDPDYVSAGRSNYLYRSPEIHARIGHFYALFESVTVECYDPTTPGPGITSYVYGTNSSLDTPSIAFSNASTMINGASSVTGVNGIHGILIAGVLVTTLLAHLF